MLIVWANQSADTFKEFVRPKLQKLDCKYKVTDEFPGGLHESDVCLAMGDKRLKVMQQHGLCPKGRAVTSQRLQVLGPGVGKYLITWDDSIINFDWAKRPDIAYDIRLAARLHDTDTLVPVMPDYTEVGGFNAIWTAIEEQHKKTGKRVAIAIDTETVGTDYMDPAAWIVAVAVTTAPGRAFIKYYSEKDAQTNEDVSNLSKMMASPKITKVYGANFKYDMLWFCEQWGIQNFTSVALDTTLVGSLIDENRSNSLNLHAKVYTPLGGYDDPFNAKYDKSRMDLVPKDDLVQYTGGDTDSGFRVARALRKQLLKDKELSRFYMDLLHPAMHAVRKMEQRGMRVDQDRYAELDEELTQVLSKSVQAMLNSLPRKLQNKHYQDLRPHRPIIVRDFLFSKQGLNLKPKILTPKTEQPSTAKAHFEMFTNHPDAGPFVEAYMEWAKASKNKSTYVDGFLKHLRSDGYFHPSYMLFRGKFHGDDQKDDDSGGRTGRTSCKEPAYQTIPKHTIWAKPLRSVFIPPDGMVILDVDFQQGELRICACVAGEKVMIASYKMGVDLHLKTGAEMNHLEFGEALDMWKSPDGNVKAAIKKIRQGGKAGNFGLIYSIGPEGFVEYARTTYGVIITVKEAAEFMRRFFKLYPGIAEWHDRAKDFAHENKYIRSPLGRVRRVPLINTFANDIRSRQERQAINAGVQSTLTDMCLLAMAELDRLFPDLWIFGFTHDSLSFYVPEHEALAWAGRIKETMENLPLNHFGWEPELDFPVDIEIGLNNLGELAELTV